MAASTAEGGAACVKPMVKPFIRTITAFVSLPKGFTCEVSSVAASRAAALTSHISAALRGAGFTVQTRRIASSSFLDWASPGSTSEPSFALPVVESFLAAARSAASDCPAPLLLCLGRMPARALAADDGLVDRVVSLLGANPQVSMSADLQAGDRSAADACARLVRELSRAGAGDGMSNFQFCVSCNVPPCTPFFPAAYAPELSVGSGDESVQPQLRFGVGLQHGALAAAAATAAAEAAAADPAANALALFEAELRQRLDAVCAEIASIVNVAAAAFTFPGMRTIDGVVTGSSPCEGAGSSAGASASAATAGKADAEALAAPPPVFVGIDTSLAPAPGEVPLTAIYEALGVPRFGGPGSLEISAAITRALQGVSAAPRVGYCGLMLPPLEDTGLAHAVACGDVTLRDILLHSTVCGIGWDTVPIAGDAAASDIAALFRDVAALSAKWSKPLSARLFPVPGLAAGQATTFDSPYLTNTTVMKL